MSEEREAQHEGYAQWIRDNAACGYRPGTRAAWFAALEWQASRQSAGATGQKPIGWANPRDLDLLKEYGAVHMETHSIQGGCNTVAIYATPIGDNGAKVYDEGAAIRLRRVLKLLDLENVAPSDDATMMGALFSVLGSVASNLERRASQPSESKRVEMTDSLVDEVMKSLKSAWNLGQIFWQQADSESWRAQDKCWATQKKFEDLLSETRALLARAQTKGE